MAKQRPPFTWHYYMMGLGGFAMLLAVSLAAWGSLVSALAFAIVSHPHLALSGPVRVVFLLIFAAMFVFAFPAADEVRAYMNGV
ncbi:MAG: hypothetical protein AB7D03_02935 [Thiomicrospira sp.]